MQPSDTRIPWPLQPVRAWSRHTEAKAKPTRDRSKAERKQRWMSLSKGNKCRGFTFPHLPFHSDCQGASSLPKDRRGTRRPRIPLGTSNARGGGRQGKERMGSRGGWGRPWKQTEKGERGVVEVSRRALIGSKRVGEILLGGENWKMMICSNFVRSRLGQVPRLTARSSGSICLATPTSCRGSRRNRGPSSPEFLPEIPPEIADSGPNPEFLHNSYQSTHRTVQHEVNPGTVHVFHGAVFWKKNRVVVIHRSHLFGHSETSSQNLLLPWNRVN